MKPTFTIVVMLLFVAVFNQNAFATSLPKLNKAPIPEWVKEPKQTYSKVSDRDIRDGYFISFYDYEVEVEKQESYTKIIKDIISENGIQNCGEIYINFNPAYQKLVLHRVNILRNGEVKDKLNLSAFKVMADEQDLARSIYKGSYAAYLILEDLRVGDKLEYAYTITGRNPIFGKRYAEDFYLQSSVPVGQIQMRILACSNRNLNFKSFNGAQLPKKVQEGNKTSYEWQATAIPALDYESYEPSWYNRYRYAQCSEWSSWQEVASWASNVNQVKTNLSGELADKVEQMLIASNGSTYKFLTLATRFVQDDIRYMGIEVGEYSHRGNTPEKVFAQRYGDCKDKSLLLASILQQGGIKASLVLVNTGFGKTLKNNLPAPSLFNHMIVYAVIDQRGQYIDPTFSGQGGDIKDLYVSDYGTGLLLSGQKAALRNIGSGGEGKVIVQETYQLVGKDSADAILTVQTLYTGYQADGNRSSFTNTGYTQMEKSYLEYYGKIYPNIRQEDSLIIDDDRDKNELRVIEKYYIGAFLKIDEESKNHQASFYANLISEHLPAITGNRKSPVATGYPFDLSYTIKVISPFSWGTKEEKIFIDRKDYLFGLKAYASADTLTLDYQFTYHSPTVEMAEIPQFISDIKQLKDKYLSYSFYINPSYNAGGVSWWAICYGIIIMSATIFYGLKLNKQFVDLGAEDRFVYEHLGGWLILLAISICLTAIGHIVVLFYSGFFISATWRALNSQGAEIAMQYKLTLTAEFTLIIIIAVLAVFAFYFMMKKRDIFPKTAILLLATLIVINILRLGSSYAFEYLTLADLKERVGFIRNGIVSSLWIAYLLRSVRVKETFIVSYRKKQNEDPIPPVIPEVV